MEDTKTTLNLKSVLNIAKHSGMCENEWHVEVDHAVPDAYVNAFRNRCTTIRSLGRRFAIIVGGTMMFARYVNINNALHVAYAGPVSSKIG